MDLISKLVHLLVLNPVVIILYIVILLLVLYKAKCLYSLSLVNASNEKLIENALNNCFLKDFIYFF